MPIVDVSNYLDTSYKQHEEGIYVFDYQYNAKNTPFHHAMLTLTQLCEAKYIIPITLLFISHRLILPHPHSVFLLFR